MDAKRLKLIDEAFKEWQRAEARLRRLSKEASIHPASYNSLMADALRIADETRDALQQAQHGLVYVLDSSHSASGRVPATSTRSAS